MAEYGLDTLAREISAELNQRWASLTTRLNDQEEAAAKADPVKHKLSKLFENNSYRYYGAKDGRGREVRFCYSCHRNVAGYFLAWREVVNKDGSGKRDGWIANRRKQTLIERQRDLAKRQRVPR